MVLASDYEIGLSTSATSAGCSATARRIAFEEHRVEALPVPDASGGRPPEATAKTAVATGPLGVVPARAAAATTASSFRS